MSRAPCHPHAPEAEARSEFLDALKPTPARVHTLETLSAAAAERAAWRKAASTQWSEGQAAVVAGDPRTAVATELHAKDSTISVQVLNNFANIARRKLNWFWTEVMEALDAFRALCPGPLPINVATHEAALEIARRDGFALTH